MVTSSPHVLGIAGSPRRNGNTALLLQRAMREAFLAGQSLIEVDQEEK
jgi:multimeric flavodoxin WrbA